MRSSSPQEKPRIEKLRADYQTLLSQAEFTTIYYSWRPMSPAPGVQTVPEETIAQQQASFRALLENLGQATSAEIEAVMAEREVVEPEAGLSPEVIKRLQERIGKR